MRDTGFTPELLLLLPVIFIIGMAVSDCRVKRDAVKHGVARWEVNPKTGDTWFEWTGGGNHKEENQ